MPYLRMLVGEQQVDEVYISEVLLNSVLSLHIVNEEKQNMLQRNAEIIQNAGTEAVFCLDAIPSAVNSFTPLALKKDH